MRPRPWLALVALALIGALWFALNRGAERAERSTEPAPTGVAGEGLPADPPLALDGARATDGEREIVDAPGSAPEPAAPAFEVALLPVERPRAELRVLVVDSTEPNAAPIEKARLRAYATPGASHDLMPFDDGRGPRAGVLRALTDGEGRAAFADLELGAWWITVERGGKAARTRVVHDGERTHRVVLNLAHPDARLFVQVVEPADADGNPSDVGIEGALVELTGGLLSGALLQGDRPAERDSPERTVTRSARTGPGGTAVFEDPGFAGFVATARTDDGRSGTAVAWSSAGVGRARSGLQIVVGEPGVLRGAVANVGEPGEAALDGARVIARLLTNDTPYYTTHGGEPIETPIEDGRYRFDALPAGTYTLAVEGAGDLRLALPPLKWGEFEMENSLDPLEVVVRAGAETVQDLRVERGGAIEGVVRAPGNEGDGGDEAGAPLRATVRATLAPKTSNYPDGFSLRGANVWRFDSDTGGVSDHPETHPTATADADGRYRLSGLAPGRYRVEVAVAGRRFDARPEVRVRAGETTSLEHVLEPAGAIAGVWRSGSYLAVARPGDDAFRMIAILPNDGAFAFAGLEPGEWSLLASHSNAGVAPVPLLTVHVEAGRTTWVDLDADAELPVRIAGRVVDAAGPVAGAHVRRAREWHTTGADGSFKLGAVFPLTMSVTLYVNVGPVQHHFEFGGMDEGSMTWKRDVAIGDERIELLTLDASGAPASAEISMTGRPTARPELSSIGVRETSGADGKLIVAPLVPGRYDVSATFADGSVAHAVLAVPTLEPLTLQAPPSGEIAALVRDAGGRPAPGRYVYATTWLGDGPIPDDQEALNANASHAYAETDAEGRVLLRGVAAGWVRVSSAQPWGSMNPGPPPEPQTLQLAAGGRAEVVLDEPGG